MKIFYFFYFHHIPKQSIGFNMEKKMPYIRILNCAFKWQRSRWTRNNICILE